MRFKLIFFSFVLVTALLFACGPRLEQSRAPVQPIRIQILALNDFHGQIMSRTTAKGEIGGAAVIRSYFNREQAEFSGETFIAHVGDLIGASPPESGLLFDEPSMMFFNLLGNKWCKEADPRCNLIATLGNHEFDRGEDELVRMIAGGNHPTGPFLDNPYRGSCAAHVSANVSGSPVDRHVTPFVVKSVAGVEIAFIGATTTSTQYVVRKGSLKHTKFKDEAKSINQQVYLLKKRGIRAIIVLIHEGGEQTPYDGPTQPEKRDLKGNILPILHALDGEVDVVLSGHFHKFTNAFVASASGSPFLVTQAESGGTAYADVELEIDPKTGDVIGKTASIKKTWAKNVLPDPEARALVERAEQAVLPRISRLVGRLETPVTREQSEAGESALGNLVADAHRHAVNADIGFMNSRGLRNDLDAGDLRWGDIFAVLPFANPIYAVAFTGAQIVEILKQQWGPKETRILQVSGLSYTWSEGPALGSRISDVRVNGKPIDFDRIYRVAANDFLALGGDRFTWFKEGKVLEIGPLDIEALETYLKFRGTPLKVGIEGRIRRVTREFPEQSGGRF